MSEKKDKKTMVALTASALADSACFIGKPVKKEVTWVNSQGDNTAIVYVKPLSYDEAIDQIDAVNDKMSSKQSIAARIASSIVDEEGNAVFTAGDIDGTAHPERGAICSSLTMALLGAIGEVNGLGKG